MNYSLRTMIEQLPPRPWYRRLLPVVFRVPGIRLFVVTFAPTRRYVTVPLFKTHLLDLHKAVDWHFWPWVGFQIWY